MYIEEKNYLKETIKYTKQQFNRRSIAVADKRECLIWNQPVAAAKSYLLRAVSWPPYLVASYDWVTDFVDAVNDELELFPMAVDSFVVVVVVPPFDIA